MDYQTDAILTRIYEQLANVRSDLIAEKPVTAFMHLNPAIETLLQLRKHLSNQNQT